MNIIQEIFLYCGYMFLNNPTIIAVIRKAIISVSYCRTSKMGHLLKMCSECNYSEFAPKSCRNRNCPNCQTFAKEKWINARLEELINTQYFHIVFTLPSELNEIIRNNQDAMYNILFKSVSETLKQLGMEKKHLGAQVGAILVLHTWDQKLLFHPHIHCVIPGGGIIDGKWLNSRKKIFIHVKVLSKVFRGKYISMLRELYKSEKISFIGNTKFLEDNDNFENFITTKLYKNNWYVYSKKTFSGPSAVIEYLGRYTHRIAITNSRILKFENGQVTFKYRDNKEKGKNKELTLSAYEFARRYLLHVLPSGFMKIRHIGFLSNRNKNTKLKSAQKLTNTIMKKKISVEELAKKILIKMSNGNVFKCPNCNSNTFNLLRNYINDAILNTT